MNYFDLKLLVLLIGVIIIQSVREHPLIVEMSKLTLNVTVMDGYQSYQKYGKTSVDDKGKTDGLFVQLNKKAMESGEFKLNIPSEYDQVTASSVANNDGDMWTGCVEDVARGETDMCIGDFWQTPQRSRISAFSLSWFDDKIGAQVLAQKSTTDWNAAMSAMFMPFSPDLWILLILLIVVLAIFQLILEGINSPEFEDQEKTRDKYFHTFTNVFKSLLEAGSALEPKTKSGKILSLGISWLSMLLIAGYTANLASMLTVQATLASADEVEALLKAGKQMCTQPSLKGMLASKDARYKIQLKPATSTNVMLGMMMKGECDGMILGNNEMVHHLFYKDGNKYLREGEFIKEHENICDLIQLTDKEQFTIPTAQPINIKYTQAYSQWINKLKEKGQVAKVLDSFWSEKKNDSSFGTCDFGSETKLSTSQLTSLGYFGAYIMLAVILVIAQGIYCQEESKVVKNDHTSNNQEFFKERAIWQEEENNSTEKDKITRKGTDPDKLAELSKRINEIHSQNISLQKSNISLQKSIEELKNMMLPNNKNDDNSPNRNIKISRERNYLDKNVDSAENNDDFFLMVEIDKKDDNI